MYHTEEEEEEENMHNENEKKEKKGNTVFVLFPEKWFFFRFAHVSNIINWMFYKMREREKKYRDRKSVV